MLYILKDKYPYQKSDGKILYLKEGTKIDKKEGDEYLIIQARKIYKIKSIIVENNPEIFEKVDLQNQLTAILKKCSKNTAPKTAKILNEYLENEYLANKELIETELLAIALEACRLMYLNDSSDKWLKPISELGWDVDDKGVFKIE